MKHNLIINPELKALIPPLLPDELAQLKANILKDGIREPIVTWNGTIVDGHNRYAIAEEFELPFQTKALVFESINHVKIWMADNALGRRNLPDFVKGLLNKIKEEAQREIGKQTQGRRTDLLSIIDKKLEQPHNTQKIVADELGWSTGKKAMFDVVRKKAPEEIKEKLIQGEVSINQAYQQIKKEEYVRKIEERIQTKGSAQIVPDEDAKLIEAMKRGETIVLNMNTNFHALKYAKDNNLYQQIDRWTDWGNPYNLPSDGDRNEVCDAFEIYLKYKKSLLLKINQLRGKALGCHCYPNRCHGDHLKQLADEKGN